MLLDITKIQQTTENLRISEEEHRLAMSHSGNALCRFNVAERTITMSPETAKAFSLNTCLQNVPEEPVRTGMIAPGSAEAYTAFFTSILNGEKTGTVVSQQRFKGEWRWLEGNFSTIFAADGSPVSAVLSFNDVTERLEKETVYRKWQQSLEEKPAGSYTLFRCNLSKDASYDTMEGDLLRLRFHEGPSTFNDRTAEYASQCVFAEDRERYASFLNSDALLANYYRGKRSDTLEYREMLSDGGYRWLRVAADLVEYPNSKDVEIYLMYENIDSAKRSELKTREKAQTDPLTGVFNRTAFAEKVNEMLKQQKTGALCALVMLDLDGFKLVNDSYGHAVGDQALIDVADKLRRLVRRGDLVGRLGGDEFFVCLRDMPGVTEIGRKAKQICDSLRKSFSVEVQLSASLGIAVSPSDGDDFDALYQKADTALYHVKATGKDDYTFYNDAMVGENPQPDVKEPEAQPVEEHKLKRRMLIVEDNALNRDLLVRMFREDFIIDTADDGNAALIRLRRYGSSISVVLLDLIMPGMDGFAVLEKMRESQDLQNIPVIIVSGMDELETSLRTIRCGASDYVTKPVDSALLRLRVQSAISKAENERLRIQNRYLAMQSDEVSKYRAVLDNDGTLLVEYDGALDVYEYDKAMSHHIAGSFDSRPLFRVLAEDGVSSREDADALAELVREMLRDPSRLSADRKMLLKTPSGQSEAFRVKVIRPTGMRRGPDSLLLTFTALRDD